MYFFHFDQGDVRWMKAKTVTIALFITILLSTVSSFPQESAPLVWEDAETRQVLFTSDDIVAFDWEKQVILLTLDAHLDFLAWVPYHMGLSRKLVVRDNEGIIYEARWVSLLSSMGYPGVIYDTYLSDPFIHIENGYPSSSFGEGDQRFAERLKSGLEKTGRLCSFDPDKDYPEYRLKIQQAAWIDYGDEMKIRIECYENTFQVGRKARAHIYMARSADPKVVVDAIETSVRLGNPDGEGETEPLVFSILPDDIAKGIFICEFDPWLPSASSYSIPRQGECIVRFAFGLQQKKGDSMTTLLTKDYPELKVAIQSSVESGVGDREWINQ